MGAHKTFKQRVLFGLYWGFFLNPIIHSTNYCVRLYLLLKQKSPTQPPITYDNPLVYIFGWYGSETTGDKAILKGIIDNLLDINPKTKFIIGSYDKSFSEKTAREINICNVASVYNRDFKSTYNAITQSTLVMVGGGPLMEDFEMFNWLKIIMLAKILRKKVIIYGCGVGPIYSTKTKQTVENILNLSDLVLLRDSESIAFSKTNFNLNKPLKQVLDPAIEFVNKNKQPHKHNYQRTVGLCIRNWPKIYYSDKLTNQQFNTARENLYKELVIFLEFLVNNNFAIRFISMNSVKGDNDLEVARELIKKLSNQTKISIVKSNLTPIETIEEIQNFDFFIGMRFHSVVFSLFINTPTIGIDYTHNQNGKIYSIMKQVNQDNYCINISQLTGATLIEKFTGLSAKTRQA